ncbi:putative nucleic acid-binding protein [groundwater metagenome]|uniref:Putative nucleic acid-binding protein n=1 Tax=groundwater metagenome TaxID=717931 RepID=A0A098E7E3_9ZZZZ
MKLADSSCIVCVFTEINRQFILMDWIKRGYQIIITEQVHKELQSNEKTYKLVSPEIKKGDITINNIITELEINTFRTRYPSLGLGESSIILTALKFQQERKRYYAILDDKNARKIALKLDLNFTGTYGLLQTLKEKEYIDEQMFNQYKQEMEKSKFRIDFNRVK